jgi:hypothetical protein
MLLHIGNFTSYPPISQRDAKMLNRFTLFCSAWHTARRIAVSQLIGIRAAFAQALRSAWASLKARIAQVAELKAATDTIVAQLATSRSARSTHRFALWQYANCHPRGGM